MIEFTLPSLGSDMDEGTLNEWMIKPGDYVERGQIVAEVETPKSAIEVECWQEGTVQELRAEVGETVPVGAVLATLLEPGTVAAQPAPAPTRSPASAPPAQAEPTLTVDGETATVPRVSPQQSAHRRWISPAARRHAHELGIDAESLPGTGPGGSVTIADVERAAHDAAPVGGTAEAGPGSTTAEPVAAVRPPAPAATDRSDRAAEMRRIIATAMSRSKREIPHYYLAETFPADRATRWVAEYNAARSITDRLLLSVLQLKAVALAAKRFPEMNGFWTDDRFQPAGDVHVGVAVALRQGGLIAPAIHDVADKPLHQIMSDLTDLVGRARAGRLRSSELGDPTITVSSLGDAGVQEVYGVIYPPQVALVGFGRLTQRPWAENGKMWVADTLTVTLSADHRASDGRRGGLFLAEIRDLLQRPDEL